MSNLKIFENTEFGKVRTIHENSKTFFCASDVANALGYKNHRKAISDHCKGVTKRYAPTPGGNQQMSFISEGDIYRLAARSALPGAERFERWIFDEVLPSIRKTGSYTVDPLKQELAEAKVRNARSREASTWLRIASLISVEDYKQICASHASAALSGGNPVIPLPAKTEAFYSATDIANETGISAITVGKIATAAGLKTPEYGHEVWDKAKNHGKQIASWRYNEAGRQRLLELLKSEVAQWNQ